MSEASFLVDGAQDNNEMGQMLPAEGSLEDYDEAATTIPRVSMMCNFSIDDISGAEFNFAILLSVSTYQACHLPCVFSG
jgi:hypothetical protein